MAKKSDIEHIFVAGRVIKVLSEFKIDSDGQFPNRVRGLDIESKLIKIFEWGGPQVGWVDHGVEH